LLQKVLNIREITIPKRFRENIFSDIKLQLQQRFSDLDAYAKDISIFQNPFCCTIEELPSYLQMKVIDIQNDEFLKMML